MAATIQVTLFFRRALTANGPAHRRRANDVRLSTEARSRRSARPVCSALSSMKLNLPTLERRLNAKSRIAIRAQVMRRPLLSMLQIRDLSLFIHLKDVREDRISLLDGAWLFPVEVQ